MKNYMISDDVHVDIPQIFTDLPYEYELYGYYVNIQSPSIKNIRSLKDVSKFIHHNNKNLTSSSMA